MGWYIFMILECMFFFFKCLVMYLFYACNLPNDSWNIFGIYLSIWLPTDLGPRKKLQMLGISLKRHEHRNQASTLKGGEQLKDSLVRTSCYVQSVVRYHISSVVCILHNLHTVNIRQYRCTVCKDIYIYTHVHFVHAHILFFWKKHAKQFVGSGFYIGNIDFKSRGEIRMCFRKVRRRFQGSSWSAHYQIGYSRRCCLYLLFFCEAQAELWNYNNKYFNF